jgi:hypothetical protein
MHAEIIEVVAYSGYRGEERPRLFMIGEERIEVSEIVNMWVEESLENKTRKRFFQVRGSNGHEYKLYCNEEMKKWFLIFE